MTSKVDADSWRTQLITAPRSGLIAVGLAALVIVQIACAKSDKAPPSSTAEQMKPQPTQARTVPPQRPAEDGVRQRRSSPAQAGAVETTTSPTVGVCVNVRKGLVPRNVTVPADEAPVFIRPGAPL